MRYSQNQIKLYPKLTSGIVTIDMGQHVDNALLSLIDITGKEVEKIKLNNTAIQTVDFSSYADGIYFLRINTANEVFSDKIVIRK